MASGRNLDLSFVTNDAKPSLLFQVMPPLMLLWPASTRHGPILYMAAGLFGLVGLISLFRIGYFLLHPDKPYRRLVRPLLAASICGLAILHTHLSLLPARKFAHDTAISVQAACNTQRRCPSSIAGWPPRSDTYSSRISYDNWVQWPILYHSDGQTFVVRLYKVLDIGEAWSGGVGKPVLKTPDERP